MWPKKKSTIDVYFVSRDKLSRLCLSSLIIKRPAETLDAIKTITTSFVG